MIFADLVNEKAAQGHPQGGGIFMRTLICCLLTVVLLPTVADACINDLEIQSHEREFRSQYNSSRMTSSDVGTGSLREWQMFGARAAGIAMLSVADGTVLLRKKK